jgi:CDP-diacylglycerol--glycerol-3-phosphate 3-phosphatidyltransferase
MLTIPNMFLFYRLLAVPVFIVFYVLNWQVAAFVMFVTAAISDFFDGYFARKLGLVNDFGKLMDTMADKILVAAAFICLTSTGAVSAWIVVVIVSREFLVTGLRSLAAAKGVVIAAGRSGKLKAVFQFVTIAVLLIDYPPQPFGDVLLYVTIVLTIYSGAEYFYHSRHLFADSAKEKPKKKKK